MTATSMIVCCGAGQVCYVDCLIGWLSCGLVSLLLFGAEICTVFIAGTALANRLRGQ